MFPCRVSRARCRDGRARRRQIRARRARARHFQRRHLRHARHGVPGFVFPGAYDTDVPCGAAPHQHSPVDGFLKSSHHALHSEVVERERPGAQKRIVCAVGELAATAQPVVTVSPRIPILLLLGGGIYPVGADVVSARGEQLIFIANRTHASSPSTSSLFPRRDRFRGA